MTVASVVPNDVDIILGQTYALSTLLTFNPGTSPDGDPLVWELFHIYASPDFALPGTDEYDVGGDHYPILVDGDPAAVDSGPLDQLSTASIVFSAPTDISARVQYEFTSDQYPNGYIEGYDQNVTLTFSPYTGNSDVVDFNNLTALQIEALQSGGDFYTVPGGTSVIDLPSTANASDLGFTNTTYNLGVDLTLGSGDDTIFGSPDGATNIALGTGDDTVHLGGGSNTLLFDGGEATIDYGTEPQSVELDSAPGSTPILANLNDFDAGDTLFFSHAPTVTIIVSKTKPGQVDFLSGSTKIASITGINPLLIPRLTTHSNGAGGTLISVGPPTTSGAPCYCRGTLIRTNRGDVPVEALAAGELVAIHDGTLEPIRWIGRRSYDPAFIAGNHLMLPVCIKAGALADGVPERDLHVSPGHAMFVDGRLVPAWRLINGVSVVQAAAAVTTVTYYHVELGRHAVILAEGAPAESFLDDGCRGQFHNAAAFHRLYPGHAAMMALAPRLEDGFALKLIQDRIAGRAGVRIPAAPPGKLRGYVDAARAGRVQGWAQDAANPESPVTLEVCVGGQPVLCLLANAYRADLRLAGMGSGCHGFDVALQDGLGGVVEVRRAADGAILALTESAQRMNGRAAA